MNYPTTMAEAEAEAYTASTPIMTTALSRSELKRIEHGRRRGGVGVVDTRGMTRQERNAIPPELRRASRGVGKHWEERAFRAIFQGFSYEYDRRTFQQRRFIVLGDVYMDNSLLTLNWRVPECAALLRMVGEVGATIEFEAQINRTGYKAREAGQPVLRGPFRKVATV